MKQLITTTLYPVTITTTLALGYYLLFPLQLPLISILAPLSLGFVVVGVAERLHPYRVKWNQSHQDIATDSLYIGINVGLREVVNLAVKLGLISLAAWIGLAENGLGIWPGHMAWSLAPATAAIASTHYFRFF